jgi:pseudomonalisin
MTPLARIATALLASAALTTLPNLHAQTTWTSTKTQATPLVGATDLGPVTGVSQITIRVGLQIHNQAALLNYIQQINDPASSLYGQSLTPQQFAAAYAPTSSQVSAVVNYLQAAGLTNIAVEPNNLLLTATGAPSQIEQAFNTSLHQFSLNGQTVFANVTPAQVPASLSGIVLSVLGLNNASYMLPGKIQRLSYQPSALPVAAPNYPASYDPPQFWTIYDAAAAPAATKTAIAIFAEGDLTQVVKDLRLEEAAYNVPQAPYQIRQVGLPSTDTSGADEWDMDTQYSTGMAKQVKMLYIYDTTSLSDSDIALEFSKFATDNLAKAGSASFGECEAFPYVDGAMTLDDEIFLEAASQGQTVFASAGDTGGACAVGPTNGVPGGPPLVNYPASSPYVVAAGGTTLLTNSNDTYDMELAWYAGGGGISQFEGAPYWQTAAAVPSSANNSRGVPDVAMDADPYSGANVYVNGSVLQVGGTSLSSPLALGVWARMLTVNPRLGFASPRLYALYNGTTTPGSYYKPGFHDITLGENVPYPATPGWDYDTGLGSFDVLQLSNSLAH